MKDDAVSSVVSAVLVFALFSTAFVLWTVQSLPEWIEDREHAHDGLVAERFADAAAVLANDDASSNGATFVVPLAPDPVSLVQRSPATATLESAPGSRLWFNMTGETVHMEGGRMLGSADEPAGGVGVGTSTTMATGVTKIDALLMRLVTDGEGQTTITVSDGSDDVTLTMKHEQPTTNCPNAGIELILVSPTSTRTAVLLCNNVDDIDYTLDVLDAPVPFAAAVARLDDELSITMSTSNIGTPSATGDVGYYAMVWEEDDVIAVAGGGSLRDADVATAGDALAYRPSFFEFDGRDILLDLGAVINQEASASMMAGTPLFRMSGTTSEPTLDWTIFDTSIEGSLTGRGTARVDVDVTAKDRRLVATGSAAAIEIQGESAAAWRSFWESEGMLSGLDSIITVEGTGSNARLVLDPTAPWVVRVTVVEATLEVT